VHKRGATFAAALALGIGPLAGAAAAATPHDETKAVASVAIRDAGFAKVAAVKVGDKLTMVNKGTKPHVAAAKGPVAFTSPTLAAGKSWAYTFTKPGTYTVLCKLHPQMKPTVIVAAPAAKAGAGAEKADATLAATSKPLDGEAAPAAEAAETVAAAEPIDTRGGRTTALLLGSFAAVALLGLLSRGLGNGQSQS
jgi:plastocyanin